MTDIIGVDATSYLTQRIASNLGVQDLTPQSKLGLLINGLVNEEAIFKTYTENSLNNFFIQTADENTLHRYGVEEGIIRLQVPTLRVLDTDLVVMLKRLSNRYSNSVLDVGYQIDIVPNFYWAIVSKEIELSNRLGEETYLSCDIKASSTEDNINFPQGSSYPITINGDDFELSFEKNVSVPVLEEDIDTYRSRLLFAKANPTTGSESAIRFAIGGNSLITDFSVSFLESPYKVVIFNHKLFDDETYDSVLTSIAIPLAETSLDFCKSEGSSFEISVAKRVDLTLVLTPNTIDPRSVSYLWYSYKEFVESAYKVGKELEISLNAFAYFLELKGESSDFLADYELTVYKNFLGNEYKSSSKSISILEDEFPFIREVRVDDLL